MDWHDIKVPGGGRIERIVGEFAIWAPTSLPFPTFKIKVIERSPTDFLAVPNVAIKDAQSGHPEWVSGLGNTPERALDDTLRVFWNELTTHQTGRALASDDFAWAAPEDF